MNMIRIVHLSDLHFNPKKDKSVWKRVATYINNEVKPDAIFITGDITDNADEREFELAVESLGLLKIKNAKPGKPNYWIVPGNHDRYELLGNNWRWLFLRKKHTYKENLFEKYFAGCYPTSDAAADIELGNTDNNWCVRIIGIDSNDPNSWFAQGSVPETEADKAKCTALADNRSDLVIALVHHHLLPIPDVERRALGRGLANVANVTGLLNAGVLLNYLSAAQVNIVLHGHEHTPHLARFSGSEVFSGTTAVLSAGSGTGEDTSKGWAFNRVHFNVLELESSRSVFLRQVSAGEAGLSLGPSRLLLTAADIRKARFVRRNRTRDGQKPERGLPTSSIKKLYLLDADRSAIVTESRTNTATKANWSITTKNASGHVDDDAEIEVWWSASRQSQRYSVPFVRSEDDDPDGFTCGLPFNERDVASHLDLTTARWRWAGAALLCNSDAKLLPKEALSGLRQEGREYVALRVESGEEFEQGSITLGMPPEYSPRPAEFRVDYEDLNQPNSLHTSEELTHSLEFCGPGHVELRIPFPSPGFCYYISWLLLSDDVDYAENRRWMQAVQSQANDLRKQALSLIGTVLSEGSIRVTLYGQVEADVLQLARLSDDGEAPCNLDLHNRRSRARTSLFGENQVIYNDLCDAKDYLLNDESLLLFVPIKIVHIKTAPDNGSQHPALLRVAAKNESGLEFKRDQQISRAVSDFIHATLSAAEHIAWLIRSKEEIDT